MKKYNELKLNERKELNELFANWLKNYTHEVIVDVMLAVIVDAALRNIGAAEVKE